MTLGYTVVFALLLSQISPIKTIACYTCIDCGDPFDLQLSNASQSLPTCAYCYKLTVYMSYAPSRYVIKECVQTCTETGSLFGGASIQVNCCQSSYCNAAFKMYPSKILFFITFLIFLCFLY